MAEETQKPRKLFRSRVDRYIGGVCGGLAEYFNMDSNLMRILFVVLVFIGGIGIILYIAGLIIVPENPGQESIVEKKSNTTLFWALLFIVVGTILLFKELGIFYYFDFWDIPWSLIWAIFLIVMGLLLIFSQSKKESVPPGGEEDSKIQEAPAKIFRSREDRMIAGVCGGLAKYFKIDSSLIRLAWVLASMASIGLGLLVYILLIFIFPEEITEQAA